MDGYDVDYVEGVGYVGMMTLSMREGCKDKVNVSLGAKIDLLQMTKQ